jgi:hypothetical protein
MLGLLYVNLGYPLLFGEDEVPLLLDGMSIPRRESGTGEGTVRAVDRIALRGGLLLLLRHPVLRERVHRGFYWRRYRFAWLQ